MAKDGPIEIYVERALLAGRDHAAIRAELSRAGWPEAEAEAALSGWAEGGVPPVPRPRAGFSFLDLMVYLLLLVALAVTAFNIVSLTHGLLEVVMPDTLDGASRWRAEQARWALATLIVAAPAYGALGRWIDRDLARNPHKRASAVRRGALGLMLAVAAIVLAGDAVVTVFTLLNGEFTLRFALKALAVALVAGGVLVIGRSDLAPERQGRAKRLVLLAGAVAVVGLAGWSLLATGVPSSVRDQRLDLQRFSDLGTIASGLRCEAGGVLPEGLDVDSVIRFCPARPVAAATLTDPETGAPYRYERLDDTRFRLCADFADLDNTLEFERFGPNWLFDAKTGCLTGRIR